MTANNFEAILKQGISNSYSIHLTEIALLKYTSTMGIKLTSLLFGQKFVCLKVLTNAIVIDLDHQWLLFDFRLNQN